VEVVVSDSQAVREYVVRKVTLIVDNTQSLYRPVKRAALDAVQNNMGTGWDRDQFVMMLGGRGQTDRLEVAAVVGSAVCGVIGEWIDYDNPLHAMLGDILDLDDRAQQELFGEHYMPEEDDWPTDDE
jgi:hypothetical protein